MDKYIRNFWRVGMLGMLLLAGCEGQSMDQVFGIGDANPPTDQATPKPKPKPTPTPTPPPPSPTPVVASGILKRNVAFDQVRSKGIAQIHQHEIDPAIATLNSAYRLKPNDRSIKLWLDAIAAAQAAKAKEPGFQNAAGGTPGQPGVPTLNGRSSNGMPLVAPPPGAPAVPPPPPAGQPNSAIDPRLVF